jgi:hypothetical protein
MVAAGHDPERLPVVRDRREQAFAVARRHDVVEGAVHDEGRHRQPRRQSGLVEALRVCDHVRLDVERHAFAGAQETLRVEQVLELGGDADRGRQQAQPAHQLGRGGGSEGADEAAEARADDDGRADALEQHPQIGDQFADGHTAQHAGRLAVTALVEPQEGAPARPGVREQRLALLARAYRAEAVQIDVGRALSGEAVAAQGAAAWQLQREGLGGARRHAGGQMMRSIASMRTRMGPAGVGTSPVSPTALPSRPCAIGAR